MPNRTRDFRTDDFFYYYRALKHAFLDQQRAFDSRAAAGDSSAGGPRPLVRVCRAGTDRPRRSCAGRRHPHKPDPQAPGGGITTVARLARGGRRRPCAPPERRDVPQTPAPGGVFKSHPAAQSVPAYEAPGAGSRRTVRAGCPLLPPPSEPRMCSSTWRASR